MRLSLLLSVASLPLVLSQQDPIHDFCRRHQHQTCIIDSKLYIDGGKVYYGASVDNSSVPKLSTCTLMDYTGAQLTSRDTELLWENVFELDPDTDFPKQYVDLRKVRLADSLAEVRARTKVPQDSKVPSVSGGVLWPDETNKLFYLYGGEYNEVTDVQTFTKLWFFDTLFNTWNQTEPSDTLGSISWPAFGSGTVSEGGTAYYYGGYLNNKTVLRWGVANPLMLSSLISFDMNTRTWSNRTLESTPRAEGMLHYLPASRSGMLVYFGGLETKPNGEVLYVSQAGIISLVTTLTVMFHRQT